ncbi:MAG: DUF1326 domain-containing protein, partial [Acidobacteria bacterium]|nr:DUF1326 domain-containing protein [Acidobacteriota bacterium]
VLLLLLIGLGLSTLADQSDVQQTPFDIEGEYTWACSCDVVCPCAFGSPNTTDNCQFPMAYHITRGTYGDLDVSGLNVVWMSLEGPKPLIKTFMEGKAVGAILIDDRASEKQQKALVDLFTRIRSRFYKKIYPPRVVPIQYSAEGDQRLVKIPGLLDLQLDLVRNNGKPVEIINAPYWVRRFYVGRALKHVYTDKALGYSWDLKGQYGDYGSFHWTDQSDLYKGLLDKWKADHPEEPSEVDQGRSTLTCHAPESNSEQASPPASCCRERHSPHHVAQGK